MNNIQTNSPSKIVLSCSGGMDSAVLLFRALHTAKEVHILTFNYGQRHSIELEYIDNLLKDAAALAAKNNVLLFHKKLDIHFLAELFKTSSLVNTDIHVPDVRECMGEAQPTSYVPNRNMLFLSICAAYAESNKIDTVWLGSAQADSLAGMWDGSEEFYESINKVIGLNRSIRMKIEAPLITLSKKEIVEEGVRLGLDFKKCWTCYSGEYPADAYTASSSLRIQGFIQAGYIDPMQYKQDLTEVWKKNNCKPL